MSESGGRKGSIVDGAALIVLVAVVLGVTAAYVGSERTFYFWDQAAYQDIASRTAAAFRDTAGSGLASLQASFDADYNALFALPLVPWLLAFGDSRLAFVLGLALLYLVPLTLAVGALAARLVPGGGRATFWLATGLALLVPMTWVPTLRGFPDSGAAALVVLATLVFLEDDRLREPRTLLKVGGLLGLAVVFRRHFAYAVVAFLLAIAAHALVERARAGRARPLGAWVPGLAVRVLAVGAIALATGVAVAPAFVRRILEHDFTSLYRSYEQPPAAFTRYFVDCYGLGTLVLAGAGFAVSAFSPRADWRRVRFVLLFGGLSWMHWLFLVRQVGEQYTLHFTPTIVVGLCLLLVGPLPVRQPFSRPAVVGLVLASSAANLALGLGGLSLAPPALRPLVAEPRPPLVRPDYDAVVDLVRSLRGGAGAEQGIFVVASSWCLNPGIVSAVDRAVSGGTGGLDLLPVPSVDSEGFYPLNELLGAGRVLVARPFQYHLSPREQVLLRTVYDTFAGGTGMAGDFTESARVFPLEDCSVSVFERRRPTSPATALAMLRAFEERLPRRPGTQPDWVTIDRRFATWVARNPDGSTALVAHPSPRGATPSTTFTALDPPDGPVSIRGTVRFTDERCRGATLRFWTGQADAPPTSVREVGLVPGDDGRFEVRVAAAPAGGRLFLGLVEHAPGESIDFCLLRIDPLVLEREAPV